MNKKIKIIDLLNKIANGEEIELPKRIKCNNHILEYIGKWQQYIGEEDDSSLLSIINEYNYSGLNDYVEILEDNTEEIETIDDVIHLDSFTEVENDLTEVRKKVNELVKAINELRKDKTNE